MRVLFLDDDPDRVLGYMRHRPNIELTWARTPEQFINEAQRVRFDILSMDHDLGFYDDGRLMTGADAVREILRRGFGASNNAHIRVHSWNPTGARVMMGLFRYARRWATYEPFPQAFL